MPSYNKALQESIEREKKGIDYSCPDADKVILRELLEEINKYAGTDIHYLAELDAFHIVGSGPIIAQYISRFSSESIRGYLIPQLVSDRIMDCDKIILQLYLHFKSSNEYIPKPGVPAPAHIYVRYDNAIKALRPKRLKDELIKLAYNPLDVFYLPFTMRMLASWKIPELKDLLLLYSTAANIAAHEVGIEEACEKLFPPLSFIKRELRFTAIAGLKYYPSAETTEIINQYTTDADSDIRTAAKRTLKSLVKSL